MKKTLALSVGMLLALGAFAQNSDLQEGDTPKIEGYEIRGKITGDYAGKVYLVKEDGMHGPQTKIDSCEVKEGRFFFKGESPKHSVIYFVQSHDGQLAPVFLEDGVINMRMRADFFLGADATGTLNNELWGLHQMHVNFVRDSMVKASSIDWMRFGYNLETEKTEFPRRTQLQNNSKLNLEKGMVRYYKDLAFAPFIMLFEMTTELSLNELKELRGQLDPKLNDHPYTQELDQLIANKEFRVGIDAPAFSMKDMEGEDLELKNFAGKYVLVDFWASWCGPCRREMPNVVKLYKECKGKNFEIVGISLDQDEQKWKAAVKELGMKWPQACDFQVWYGKTARQYNVNAVPYTVLINPEGKIEAINLRGEELIKTVKTLLKK